MRINKLSISCAILKEKEIIHAQELHVEEFHASNGRFERWKMGNFFWIYKAIEKQLFYIFQPILKSSDLTNPRYIEQNYLVPSEFIKTRVHCIYKLTNIINKMSAIFLKFSFAYFSNNFMRFMGRSIDQLIP